MTATGRPLLTASLIFSLAFLYNPGKPLNSSCAFSVPSIETAKCAFLCQSGIEKYPLLMMRLFFLKANPCSINPLVWLSIRGSPPYHVIFVIVGYFSKVALTNFRISLFVVAFQEDLWVHQKQCLHRKLHLFVM